MNDPSPLMMSRSYGMWLPPVPTGDDASNPFPNPNRPTPFPAAAAVVAPKYPPRTHWKPNIKGKKPPSGPDASAVGLPGPSSFMTPLDPSDPLQQRHQNRSGRPPRRFYKKKHNNNSHNRSIHQHPASAAAARSAPFAPRNTTSFLIRAKRAGGVAPLVSPFPVTPAVLPTPEFSPSFEALVDSAKEEWGVDGYGSMNGLIRLRSPRTPAEVPAPVLGPQEEAAEEGSGESDLEEHVEVERRLDHDLRRFEMLYCPSLADQHDARESPFLLGGHVDDQDAHLMRLEEENLTLRDRLFLMERDMADMRRRLATLEMDYRRGNANARDGNSQNNNNNNEDNQNNNNNDNNSAVDEVSETEEAEGVCSEKSVGD